MDLSDLLSLIFTVTTLRQLSALLLNLNNNRSQRDLLRYFHVVDLFSSESECIGGAYMAQQSGVSVVFGGDRDRLSSQVTDA